MDLLIRVACKPVLDASRVSDVAGLHVWQLGPRLERRVGHEVNELVQAVLSTSGFTFFTVLVFASFISESCLDDKVVGLCASDLTPESQTTSTRLRA